MFKHRAVEFPLELGASDGARNLNLDVFNPRLEAWTLNGHN